MTGNDLLHAPSASAPIAGPIAGPIAEPTTGAWTWQALGLVSITCQNGLTVVLAENHTVPLLFLSWTSAAGFDREPLGLEGIASFCPSLCRAGTARRDGAHIAQALDDLGAELATGVDWDRAFLNIGLLSRDLEAGLDLLIEMATAPRPSAATLTRLKQQRLAALERRRRDPRACAHDELARAVFGETLYARSPLGTAASVSNIDATAVQAFHADHYGPGTSCLVVAGSFDADRVMNLLGSLVPQASLAPSASPTRRGEETQLDDRRVTLAAASTGDVHLVDMPHAARTEISVGAPGVSRDSDALPGLELLMELLGGGPTSRLAQSLRQREALTYDVRAHSSARRLGGVLTISTSVAHEAAGATLSIIHREIARLRDERVSRTDIEQARRALHGADLRLFQDLIGAGATLGGLALAGDPAVHLERRRTAMETIDPDALRDLARRYFAADRLHSIVAGPATALRSQR